MNMFTLHSVHAGRVIRASCVASVIVRYHWRSEDRRLISTTLLFVDRRSLCSKNSLQLLLSCSRSIGGPYHYCTPAASITRGPRHRRPAQPRCLRGSSPAERRYDECTVSTPALMVSNSIEDVHSRDRDLSLWQADHAAEWRTAALQESHCSRTGHDNVE